MKKRYKYIVTACTFAIAVALGISAAVNVSSVREKTRQDYLDKNKGNSNVVNVANKDDKGTKSEENSRQFNYDSITTEDVGMYAGEKNFDSKRLIVYAYTKNDIPEQDKNRVIADYGKYKLIQYDTVQETGKAYIYYISHGIEADSDIRVKIADNEDGEDSEYIETSNKEKANKGETSFDESKANTKESDGILGVNKVVRRTKRMLFPSLKGYKVGVIDTGVDNTVNNVVGKYSVLNDDGTDKNGHGTKIAKSILETSPEAEILSIKALNDNGYGDTSAIYAAIEYAISQDVDVINMSFSGFSTTGSYSLQSAIDDALNKGIVVIAAAGNNDMDASWSIPGGLNGVVTIGSMDEYASKIESSNFGSYVDYYVQANSTSEAAAKFTGMLVQAHADEVNGTKTESKVKVVQNNEADGKNTDNSENGNNTSNVKEDIDVNSNSNSIINKVIEKVNENTSGNKLENNKDSEESKESKEDEKYKNNREEVENNTVKEDKESKNNKSKDEKDKNNVSDKSNDKNTDNNQYRDEKEYTNDNLDYIKDKTNVDIPSIVDKNNESGKVVVADPSYVHDSDNDNTNGGNTGDNTGSSTNTGSNAGTTKGDNKGSNANSNNGNTGSTVELAGNPKVDPSQPKPAPRKAPAEVTDDDADDTIILDTPSNAVLGGKWTQLSAYDSKGTMLYPGQWSYVADGDYINNAEDTNNMTGFYNPHTNYEYMDVSVDMGSWDRDDDYMGLLLHTTEDTNHNVTSYVFLLTREHTGWENTPNTPDAGLYRLNGVQFDYNKLTPVVTWKDNPQRYFKRNEYQTVRMVYENSNVKCYIGNELVVDYNDPDPIKTGSFGFVSLSQPKTHFTNIRGRARLASYILHFDPTGGKITDQGDADENNDLKVVSTKHYRQTPTATRYGYDFNGWYATKTAAEYSHIVTGDPVEVHESQNVNARWTPHKFNLNVDPNGGMMKNGDKMETGLYSISPLEFDASTGSSIGVAPIRSGYTFKGWYTAKTGGKQIYDATGKNTNDGTYWVNNKYKYDGDLTVYAQWEPIKYKITYDLDGGSTVGDSVNEYTIESDDIVLQNPVKDGYAFEGWTGTELTDVTPNVIIKKGSIGDRSYKATWGIVPIQIKFNGNGGTIAGKDAEGNDTQLTQMDVTKHLGDKIGKAPVATRDGYTLLGWYTEDGEELDENEVINQMPKQNGNVFEYYRIYYAKWVKQITGVSIPNGVYEIVSNNNSELALNNGANVSLTGVDKATKWKTVDTGNKIFQFTDVTDANKTLGVSDVNDNNNGIAVTKKYTGDGSDSFYLEKGDSDTAYRIESKGGSHLGLDAGESTDGSTVGISDPGMASSQNWLFRYEVHYDANGGQGESDNQVWYIGEGQNLAGSTLFTRQGYSFKGWSTTPNGEVEYQPGQFINDIHDPNNYVKTLYAVWGPADYRVNFDGNGGTGSMQGITVSHGSETKTQIPANTYTKDRSVFEGWSTTPNGDVMYSDRGYLDAKINPDNLPEVTLYAQWSSTGYIIHFKGNGGTGTMADMHVNPADIGNKTLPANGFTNNNYKFSGWLLEGSDNTFADQDIITGKMNPDDSAEVTLVAQWGAQPYTIRYNSNGGTGTMADQTVNYGERTSLSGNRFTRTGYYFTGWSRTPNGPVEFSDLDMVSNLTNAGNTITLYAKWTKGDNQEGNPQHITIDGDSASTRAYKSSWWNAIMKWNKWSHADYVINTIKHLIGE